MKLPILTLPLAMAVFLGSNADALSGTRIDTQNAAAAQMVRADFFESSMAKYDDDIRLQMTRIFRKAKTSSDIGYPMTANITNISSYDIIQKNNNIYEVHVKYLVVAAVDTAIFEDVFVMELANSGHLRILELKGSDR